ncbi:hypothetical protein PCASD_15414 [Puccinia coronata f. sp. avenae]|uniref:Uncharacterized protein n=1 Tax=Puccinia coronata f. sp. avenae TaxID=200324 RepID=A0A2N5TZ39_9BASI|nr:hypothetical protein PCASD_15414 [Puccinia coronata f. sp. avenae]
MGSILPSKETPSSFAQIYVTGGNDLAEATCRAFQAHCPVDSLILLEIQQYLSQHNTYARFFRLIGRKEASRNSPEYHLRNYLRSDLDQNVYNAPRTLEGWIYGMPSGTERGNSTAGINRSNTAVRAVLELPCLTGGRTGTVRPKHLPPGRTGLSDQFLGPVAQDQPGPVGQICPTSWLLLRSDSARPTTGRTRLFEHCSNCRV